VGPAQSPGSRHGNVRPLRPARPDQRAGSAGRSSTKKPPGLAASTMFSLGQGLTSAVVRGRCRRFVAKRRPFVVVKPPGGAGYRSARAITHGMNKLKGNSVVDRIKAIPISWMPEPGIWPGPRQCVQDVTLADARPRLQSKDINAFVVYSAVTKSLSWSGIFPPARPKALPVLISLDSAGVDIGATFLIESFDVANRHGAA